MVVTKVENLVEQHYLASANGINISRFKGTITGANIDKGYRQCSQGIYEPFCILVPMKHRRLFAELTHWYFRFRGAQIIFTDTMPNDADEIIFHSLSPKYPCAVMTVVIE